MKLELHLIQSFGPNCLNRDATNSPKSCEFGGAMRARVSSQCFKRAMREFFREENLVPVGERTKRLRAEIGAFLPELEPRELVDFGVDAFVDTYYAKNDSKRPEHASVLLFLSRVELEEAARCIEDSWNELRPFAEARRKKIEEIRAGAAKKKAAPTQTTLPLSDDETATQDTSDGSNDGAGTAGDGKFKELPKPKADKAIVERLQNAALSSDIALFGRMLAEHSEHRIEAAAQVAHAISTHAVSSELDFFSAVDDLNTDDAGAGMLGVTGFNSAVFYRYALLDFDALVSNLKGDREAALATARAFLQAFVEAIPSGKQNSMAAQSLPSLGLFVTRESGAPCSMVNAFCEPITRHKAGGMLRASIAEFADYWNRYTRVYGERGINDLSLFCFEKDDALGTLGAANKSTVDNAIDSAMEALAR